MVPFQRWNELKAQDDALALLPLAIAERKLLAEAFKRDTFPCDHSYFKWQDIPVEVRRQMVHGRSWAGRTWVYGRTAYQMDVPLAAARELYNVNWDGCRDLWKEQYRYKKHPDSAPPPRYAQTKFINWLSGSYMTVEEEPARPTGEISAQPEPSPLLPIDTEQISQYKRQAREREQAYQDAFNRMHQRCYQKWLGIRKARQQGTHGWRSVAQLP